jgi:hypothetical protein
VREAVVEQAHLVAAGDLSYFRKATKLWAVDQAVSIVLKGRPRVWRYLRYLVMLAIETVGCRVH